MDMENINSIVIGYSNKVHESLIGEFRHGLPSVINVESYLQDRYFSADGQFYPLVIGFSEWVISNSGTYILNILLDKVRELIKGHIKEYNDKASFELILSRGENSKVFKAENVSENSAMRAFDEFIKLAKSDNKKLDFFYDDEKKQYK